MRFLIVGRQAHHFEVLAFAAKALSVNHEVFLLLSDSESGMVYAPSLFSFNPDAVLVSVEGEKNLNDVLALLAQCRIQKKPVAIYLESGSLPEELVKNFRDYINANGVIYFREAQDGSVFERGGFRADVVLTNLCNPSCRAADVALMLVFILNRLMLDNDRKVSSELRW